MNSFYLNLIKGRLNGLLLARIGRTCNMLELNFSLEKKPECCNEIWHIQSPFRFILGGKTLLTDRDMYIPNDDHVTDCRYDDAGFESRFDYIVGKLNFLQMSFIDVNLSLYEDVTISVSIGKERLTIETFNNAEQFDAENWRFFRHHHAEPHIVCYRDEILME